MNSAYFQTLDKDGQNDMMSSILSTLPAVIFLFDIKANKYLYISPSISRILGYSQEDMYDMDSYSRKELIHPEDHEDYVKGIQGIDALLPNEMFASTLRLKDKTGHYNWFINKTLSFKKDKNGHTSILLCIVRDITDEVKNKLIAEDQINKIGQASFDLSHDLRHEHAKVLAIVRLLKGDVVVTQEEFRILVEAIKVSVEKIDDFIRSLNRQLEEIKEQLIDFNFGNHN